MWARPGSVEVERRADRVGEAGFLMIQEPADLIAERGRGNRRDVIARDDAPILETVRGAEFDFGGEPADRRGDRCDGDRVEVRAYQFAGEDQHRTCLVQACAVDRSH
jgi:hypothetical protein